MTSLGRRLSAVLLSAFTRLGRAREGNVTIIFAFAAVPLLMAIGSGADYGLAIKRQGRMNAAADAAALYAASPTMMASSSTVAQAAAVSFFNTQVSGVSGTTYNPANLSITVTDTTVNGSINRVAKVSYNAASTNNFAQVFNVATLAIKGTSTATSAVSPNIDFYLMLDNSPSMAIAATTSGITTMVNHTSSQGGCAFACHQTNPAADGLGNPGGIDNYQLARNLGVTLRIDMVSSAVQSLTSTASSTSSNNGAIYRMAGYTFNLGTTKFLPLTSNMSTAQSAAASGISIMTVYKNSCVTASNCNHDEDTNFDQAFTTLNTAMPVPGNGTNAPLDSPQEVLFLVTDGVADAASGSSRVYTPFGPGSASCSTIKARGIRIAVLYTTYNPLPTNSWYNTYIAPLQSTIAPAAQSCASPGLFFQVDTGGDISAAMRTLFQTAVSSAHLTN